MSIAKEVVLRVEQLAKKDGFRPHAEPFFRTCTLLTAVEENDNNNIDNNIEENVLSNEEDSDPDVLYEDESASDAEQEQKEETFIPGVEDDQSIGSMDPNPDGDPISEPLC